MTQYDTDRTVFRGRRDAHLSYLHFSRAAERQIDKRVYLVLEHYDAHRMYAAFEDGYQTAFRFNAYVNENGSRIQSNVPGVLFNSVDDVLLEIHRSVALACWSIKFHYELSKIHGSSPENLLGFSEDQWDDYTKYIRNLVGQVFGFPKKIRYHHECDNCVPMFAMGMYDVYFCLDGTHQGNGYPEIVVRYGEGENARRVFHVSNARVDRARNPEYIMPDDIPKHMFRIYRKALQHLIDNPSMFGHKQYNYAESLRLVEMNRRERMEIHNEQRNLRRMGGRVNNA